MLLSACRELLKRGDLRLKRQEVKAERVPRYGLTVRIPEGAVVAPLRDEKRLAGEKGDGFPAAHQLCAAGYELTDLVCRRTLPSQAVGLMRTVEGYFHKAERTAEFLAVQSISPVIITEYYLFFIV